MNPHSQAFWMALVFVTAMVGTACDDPPANQAPAPKSTPSKKVKGAKSALPSAAKSVTQETPSETNDSADSKRDARLAGLLAQAGFEEHEGEVRKAISTLQTLLRERPNDTVAMLRLAALQKSEGNREDALRQLERGLTLAPKSEDLLRACVGLLVEMHEHDRAGQLFGRLMGVSKRPKEDRIVYARLLFKTGAWASSVEQFRVMDADASLKPADVVSYAKALGATGDIDGGLKLLSCNAAEPPAGFEGTKRALRCGTLLNEKGNYTQAERFLNVALGEARDAATLSALGVNSLGQGRYDRALEQFTRAASMDPKALDAQLGFARALRALGGEQNSSKALRALNRVIDAYARETKGVDALEKDPVAFLERAEIFLQLGREKRAMEDLDSGLALAPAHPGLAVTKAKALYYGRRTGEAMALLTTLLKRSSALADAHYFLARMHLAERNRREAIKHFESSLRHADRSFRNTADAHASLASLFRESNTRGKMCKHLKLYLQTAPGNASDRFDVADEVRRLCR